MSSTEDNKKVWFIAGSSSGIGLGIVQRLVELGHSVASTSRLDTDALLHNVKEGIIANATTANYLPLKVDLTSDESVKQALTATVERFGRLDVVVNNAGFAMCGTIEELSDAELKEQFEINVFAAARVMRLSAPILRQQKSGYVINMSSLVGIWGHVAGIGAYCASKFAISGLTESFQTEMEPFGIKATAIHPGYFRSEMLDEKSMKLAKTSLDAYKASHDHYNKHRDEVHHQQRGDPKKLGEVLVKIVNYKGDKTPTHVFIGPDSVHMARTQVKRYLTELDEWEPESTNTDFDHLKGTDIPENHPKVLISSAASETDSSVF
ncbi:short-chain dehydrogenase/reductase family protein [Heterostelium album PN500]|uniref:Short-chain dehydrogenase/reductase family protein n=1 Tax=Heterostelium pallidum (strain ATCC 26659 / Pp 5 / PN500) TaxID=670386 RepID=D3BPQ8_HETP5|nr:short-chain dehydrogenase/reductase family protein [Heterostelium album PN500]EFA76620.1 short-chain dehydrogenase/reductase family protein [Heterostelium album PN500]|eukprot:XP_020428752.1 short-chain dehydrogenase/reductase family protein [Heterostelium album PN500]